MKKKIVYVLPTADMCGGVKVVAEHVTGLASRGHDAQVWHLQGNFGWFGRNVPATRFQSLDAIGPALRTFSGVKVATFWTTATWITENLRPGEQGYYFVQDEDELTYGGSSAGNSYKIGLRPIYSAKWVHDEIESKYKCGGINVGIGLDHRIYRPLPMVREQFRVFTPYRTTSAGPRSLKGWDITEEVLKKVARLEPRASVVTFGKENSPRLPFIPHIHVKSPSDLKLRELYSQAGVFLSCSRHEGFGLPMLEAMACGLPVVCTDSHGNREFCRHNDTAMVHDAGDATSLAASIIRVMTEPGRADTLRVAGLGEVKRYQWGNVIDNLEDAYGISAE